MSDSPEINQLRETDANSISPCVGECRLDSSTQACVGCDRTAFEISVWSQLAAKDRLTIMAECEKRRADRLDSKPSDKVA